MADGADAFLARLASLERRLSNLETAPRAPYTSVRGGFTRWLPADGSIDGEMIHIGSGTGDDVGIAGYDEDGEQWFGAGSDAGRGRLFVSNPDHTNLVLEISDGKMLRPLISCAWQSAHDSAVDTFGRPVITSGAYWRVWACLLPVTTGQVFSTISVTLGTGITSADVRIRATSTSAGNTGAQTVVEQTGITVSGFLAGAPWTIPDGINSPSGSPVGHFVLLELEGRVAGGAGDLAVAPVQPVANWPV